ncbi:hypothetical protein [Fundidesulfovibrio agrisoli]|uniref:hypothetical protein n=1 Tax=Fundidesulfovibrio agrisoli TaxID=2922717 RepID=UPI001FADE5AB|nr:hypothetical protein [Fundidesulfovibrio agrisoli]
MSVYSFAIFDTCLARIHARPTDLLYALAARVLPGSRTREDMHEFVRLRLAAEQEARQGPGLEAAGLGMVYERFPQANPWELDPEALYSSELELALASVRPVPPVLERVRAHVRRGERVVYVTDSLLPGAALRRLLESHGFAGEVYAAGDLGKTKAKGTLFSHALGALGIAAQDLLHVGADKAADASVPRSLGIAVEPFVSGRLTPHEQRLLSLQRDCAPEASRVVAACRLARLRDEPAKGLASLRAFACGVVGPALTAFVAWAMDDAARRGADRLYFLAREGEALWRIAKALHPVTGGPEPRYLMGSLAAWTAPLLAAIGRSDLGWLAAEGQSRRPADLLARLSLTPEELLQASGLSMPGLLSDAPLDDEGIDALWRLLDTPGARELLRRKAEAAHAVLLAYLEGQGALEGATLAVADMGWTLYTQRALKAVLAERGVDVAGWYFGLAGRRLGRVEAGAHRALFIEHAGQAAPGGLESMLFRNQALMERAFTPASHGRVLGYSLTGGKAAPLLAEPPQGQEVISEIQEGALAFARAFADGGWSEAGFQALMETARQSLAAFLSEPDTPTARAVAALPGLREGKSGPMRRITGRDALRAWMHGHGLGRKSRKGPQWIEGSVAISAAWLRPYLRRPRFMALLRAYFS